MKGIVMAMSAAMVLSSSWALAQTNTPVIDQRQGNQEQRIDKGIASGQLTEREANRLNRQQNRIDKMENHVKADGEVTNRERRALNKAQNHTSKSIARQKHDRQGARHQ